MANRNGLSKQPEYHIWYQMIRRCTLPNHPKYESYGGRGIKVAEEWLNDPGAFIEHIGPRPSRNHSLDRIDNDGNYEPDNVRWATRKQQMNNTRKSLMITAFGKTLTTSQWARELGTYKQIIQSRIDKGMDPSLAVIEVANGVRSFRYMEFRGVTKKMTEWAREFGLRPNTVNTRLRAGWSLEEALMTPIDTSKRNSKARHHLSVPTNLS